MRERNFNFFDWYESIYRAPNQPTKEECEVCKIMTAGALFVGAAVPLYLAGLKFRRSVYFATTSGLIGTGLLYFGAFAVRDVYDTKKQKRDMREKWNQIQAEKRKTNKVEPYKSNTQQS